MKESEAADIVALLAAGFPSVSLEPASVALWVETLVPLEAEAASKTALSFIRLGESFPPISLFLQSYRHRIGAREFTATGGSTMLALLPPESTMPTWVRRWKHARWTAKDDRVFPEQRDYYTDEEVEARGGWMPEEEHLSAVV